MCETHHSVVLAFRFNPLTPSSVHNLLTSSLPLLRHVSFFFVITIYDKDLSPSFPPALCPPFPPQRLDASTGPPAAAVVSAARVLCPAGVGGRLPFVAVQESGRDDQNGPQEENAVEDSRQHRQLEKM